MERRILVVSDATASTAEDVLRAALGVDTSLKSLEESAVEVVSLATDLPYRRGPEDR